MIYSVVSNKEYVQLSVTASYCGWKADTSVCDADRDMIAAAVGFPSTATMDQLRNESDICNKGQSLPPIPNTIGYVCNAQSPGALHAVNTF